MSANACRCKSREMFKTELIPRDWPARVEVRWEKPAAMAYAVAVGKTRYLIEFRAMRKAKKLESKPTPGSPNSVAGQDDLSSKNVRIETDSNAGPWLATRLKALREAKDLSQGDVEKRTGLLRCYISRVENGHNVPTVDTLEKLARALEVPIYQLFYDGDQPPKIPNLPKQKRGDAIARGSSNEHDKLLEQFRRLLSKMSEKDRGTLLLMAYKMARSRGRD
jgi:transcriptional regulator with XRE-family HTH domain